MRHFIPFQVYYSQTNFATSVRNFHSITIIRRGSQDDSRSTNSKRSNAIIKYYPHEDTRHFFSLIYCSFLPFDSFPFIGQRFYLKVLSSNLLSSQMFRLNCDLGHSIFIYIKIHFTILVEL